MRSVQNVRVDTVPGSNRSNAVRGFSRSKGKGGIPWSTNCEKEMRGRIIRWSVIVSLLLLLFVTKPFVIVRAGDVGVIYSFGSIIGQVEEGFHLIPPWYFVTHTNIRVQRAVL